jgi:hypothetical protein
MAAVNTRPYATGGSLVGLRCKTVKPISTTPCAIIIDPRGGPRRKTSVLRSRRPPVAPASKNEIAVSKEMRVYTREGAPRISDIVGRLIDVWTGDAWTAVRVSVGPPAEYYRVRLDDGTCLVSAADHPWAIVSDGGGHRPVLTRDLREDLAVSAAPGPRDAGGVADARAYDLGAAYGVQMLGRKKRKSGGPTFIFDLDRVAFGLYISGWMDSQRGAVFGPHEAIHDLQVAAGRHDIRTIIENRGTTSALIIPHSSRGAIPNPRGVARDFPDIIIQPPRIVEVFRLRRRERTYTITPLDKNARTVVLDGVLTRCCRRP